MRYKAILMDADETLFDFEAGNRNAVSALLDGIGYDHPDRYEQYQAVNHACWRLLEQGKMTQGELKLARWARFFTLYSIQADPAEAADRFIDLLGGQSILLPHAEEVVRAIAARLPVLVLTNGITQVQKRRMAASPLRQYIAGMVISQEVGVSKPDPAIFRIALDRLGVGPRDALMVGDGITSDVIGANRAGVDVCFYDPQGRALPPGVHAEYRIADLRQCVPIALAE